MNFATSEVTNKIYASCVKFRKVQKICSKIIVRNVA